jgi:glycosyltransferase involved in cell wall biosynthesis
VALHNRPIRNAFSDCGRRKMRQALIVTALAGFVRSFLTNDIRLLQERGYKVSCAANINHPGADGMETYFEKLDIDFFQIDFSSNEPLSKASLDSYRELKDVLVNTHFDLIHCHTPIAGALCRIVSRGLRKKGTKVIYTTHGFYFHKKSGVKAWLLYYPVEWFLSGLCDAIVTINQEDYQVAKGMRCSRVYHINGVGVDTDKFWNVQVNRDAYRHKLGIGPDDVVVLSVGELSRRKNQKVVVDALALINEPRLVLVHCGNAMNNANTKREMVDAANCEHVRLIMLGLRNDMPQICKCADIGTISSTREGLGLAGIEMLASGLPLVASAVQGILDYAKDGGNGFLADPLEPRSFARGIKKLLDPMVREGMRQTCHDSSLPFDSSVANAQMAQIYDDVLAFRMDSKAKRCC